MNALTTNYATTVNVTYITRAWEKTSARYTVRATAEQKHKKGTQYTRKSSKDDYKRLKDLPRNISTNQGNMANCTGRLQS
jgi:hypothetical protein